jgi:hypothetical protein
LAVNRIFFFLSKVKSCYATQAGLELEILLPQPPECWGYRGVPPCPAAVTFISVLFMHPSAGSMGLDVHGGLFT